MFQLLPNIRIPELEHLSLHGINIHCPISQVSATWEWSRQLVTVVNKRFTTRCDPVEELVALIMVSLQKSQCCCHAFGFVFGCKVLHFANNFQNNRCFLMISCIVNLFCNHIAIRTAIISTRQLRVMRCRFRTLTSLLHYRWKTSMTLDYKTLPQAITSVTIPIF